LQLHPKKLVLFIVSTQNFQTLTYKPEANNHVHKMLHIKEYLDVKQLPHFPWHHSSK
jgi:hypothetical protein